MQIVVDANIIISSLISGHIAELIFSPKLELYAPDLLFSEIRKHKLEIISKSALSETEIEILFGLIENQITIIPRGNFEHLLNKAEKLLEEHKKDAPFVALAMYLNCPLWSYEKRFGKIMEIQVVSTLDLRLKLLAIK